MLETLAQYGSSGGSGGWINAGTIKVLFWALFFALAGIATVVRKAKEARAKRDTELRRQMRDEQVLRTGRPDAPPALPNVASPTMRPSTAEDARRKLQELAERRRRELAEMMRRAQQGKAATGGSMPAPPTPPQARPLPRPMPQRPAPPTMRPAPIPQAQRNVITPPRTFAEENLRRKQQAETKRRAEREADARRQVVEEQKTLRDAADRSARETAPASTPNAYQSAPVAKAAATAARQAVVGAALSRVGGSTSAAEWRRAIVLSEILHAPVALRPTDEHAM
jgi:hypothetical protein